MTLLTQIRRQIKFLSGKCKNYLVFVISSFTFVMVIFLKVFLNRYGKLYFKVKFCS